MRIWRVKMDGWGPMAIWTSQNCACRNFEPKVISKSTIISQKTGELVWGYVLDGGNMGKPRKEWSGSCLIEKLMEDVHPWLVAGMNFQI